MAVHHRRDACATSSMRHYNQSWDVMTVQLSERAAEVVDRLTVRMSDLRVARRDLPGGGCVLDFGVEAEGGLAAGVELARICLSGLADVELTSSDLGGMVWPHVQVSTDSPTAACLLSQYAGWQVSVGKYFAMGSGPMRAAAAREELFDRLSYRETPGRTVGVLEGSRLPDETVFQMIAEKTGVPAGNIALAVAPTSSLAGSLQVVARSVETALHKLFELGFDVRRIRSAYGIAPLPPVAADDLSGIGRTNDAILYGGRVVLWVTGDDASLEAIGPQVPSAASPSYGRPFLELFEAAGRDFYQIDPHLFSPAEVVIQNLETGRVHRYGRLAPDVVKSSFGLN